MKTIKITISYLSVLFAYLSCNLAIAKPSSSFELSLKPLQLRQNDLVHQGQPLSLNKGSVPNNYAAEMRWTKQLGQHQVYAQLYSHDFQGLVPLTDSNIHSRYGYSGAQLAYRNQQQLSATLNIYAGAGLSYQLIQLQSTASGQSGQVLSDEQVQPNIHAGLSHQLGRNWSWYAQAEVAVLNEHLSEDYRLGLSYQFNPQWQASFGMQEFYRELKLAQVQNQLAFDSVLLQLRHAW